MAEPLWKVLEAAYFKGRSPGFAEGPGYAAEIRALRDWLVPEEKAPPQRQDIGGWNSWHDNLCWKERQRLRALLTAEAERAEKQL